MIDEKKIEEAAEKECGGLVLAKGGFKAGINWFLDNLWHDVSEVPRFDKHLLVEFGKENICRMVISPYHVESLFFFSYSNDRWKRDVVKSGATRWLYIDDLLKGGK